MVEKQPSCMEWEGPTPSIHRSYHRDRCIPPRVGGGPIAKASPLGNDGPGMKAHTI